jgi:uncharacterized protein YjiS (DUF1127 family)
MTTHEIHAPSETTGQRLQSILAVSASRVAAVWRAAQNRRSVGRLLEWDDRMLRDIGLTQGDVRSALAAPVAEDPSQQLRLLSGERRQAIRASARENAVRNRYGLDT